MNNPGLSLINFSFAYLGILQYFGMLVVSLWLSLTFLILNNSAVQFAINLSYNSSDNVYVNRHSQFITRATKKHPGSIAQCHGAVNVCVIIRLQVVVGYIACSPSYQRLQSRTILADVIGCLTRGVKTVIDEARPASLGSGPRTGQEPLPGTDSIYLP